MARAIILTVDDDPDVSQAITRDLRSRYGDRYRLARATSGAEALSALEEFARRDQPVALIVSDHRMPEMTGIELLAHSKATAPNAKLVLLTAYADTDVAIRAINDIGLDHYLMKPWAPPEERLFPVLDDLLDDWESENIHRFDGIRVVGNRWSERSHDTRMFLARNHVHYQWLELERDAEAARLQALFGGSDHELPLVVLPDGTVLHGAGPRDLADASGLRTSAGSDLYDLVVIGAGPAGLAAAVYGASEGLRTAVIERDAPGGQAAQSARIENYLGFPKGVSGADLSHRAVTQARRLGAEMVLARHVEALEHAGPCARRPIRRRQRDRSASGRRGHRSVVPPARGARPRRADGSRRVLRRGGERCTGDQRRRCLHRGRRELGRPSGAAPRPIRQARRAVGPRRRAGEVDVAISRRANTRHRQHRGAAADRDRVRRWRRSPGVARARRPIDRRTRTGCDELAVRLHRRISSHRLAAAIRSLATARASSSPGPTSPCARARRLAGRCSARRSCWKPAARACSPSATFDSNR